MKFAPRFFVATLLLAIPSAAIAQERASLPPEMMGPMVGHVTSTEATIWLYAGENPQVVVQYRSLADSPDRVQAVRPKADPAAHNAVKAQLIALKLQPHTNTQSLSGYWHCHKL